MPHFPGNPLSIVAVDLVPFPNLNRLGRCLQHSDWWICFEWPICAETVPQHLPGAAKVPPIGNCAIFRLAAPNRPIKPIYLQS